MRQFPTAPHPSRASRMQAFVPLLLLMLCCAAPGALHAQVSTSAGDGAASVQVERNVYAAGGKVQPEAPVRGDFSGAAGRVELDQPVSGDAALAGGSVVVRAPVAQDLRIGAGDVSLDSTVGGELFVMGGNVTLSPATRIARGARLYAGELTIGGRIGETLEARARRIVLDGEVGGDVDLSARQIELGPNARVAGALRYSAPTELVMAPGATVAGAITRESGRAEPSAAARREGPAAAGERTWGLRIAGWVGGTLLFLGVLAFAAVMLLVAPGFAARTADRIRIAPGPALGFGLLVALAVPVVAGVLFITVLGIPIGLMLLSLYPGLLLLGLLLGVLFLARLMSGALRRGRTDGGFVLDMVFIALALLVLTLLSNVPVVGALALALFVLAGTGALVLEGRDWRRRRRDPLA
ncbi:hypothetical protein WG922_06250 [Ramlibacter sp. AN1015]|uniref:hypothetical protein n=1 Tax=Ramlibacter sp. AN1015 TaxID=3133428 RepID=UPI0030BF6C0A